MSLQLLEDKELVSAYIKGNEAALEILIGRHKDRIYSHIYNLVRQEQLSNDIFQETFIKVIKTLKKGKYNEEGKFLPWVMRIAHNLVIDTFRRAKRMPKVRSNENFDVFDTIKEDKMSVEEDMIHSQIMDEVKDLIEELPDDQKEVLKLRHYSGLSFKEIAEETDVSINTALGRMRYALINLRKMIDERKLELTYY